VSAYSAHLTAERAGELVSRARAGEADAWSQLVDGYLGLLTASLRAMNLSDADIRDVTQTTWLRLVQNIDRIEEPARVGSWLVTTARREGLRVIGQRRWLDVRLEADEEKWIDLTAGDAFDNLLNRERDEAVQAVFEQLPQRCQALLNELFQDDKRPYDEIGRVLQMPIGSIGPTRARCLKKFCALAEQCGVDLRALTH